MKPKDVDPGVMALAVLEQRRRQDPLTHFQPSETQKRYLTRMTRYATLNGPTRGGKTAANAVDLAQCARRIHATKTVRSVNGIYLVFATARESIRDNWYGKLRVASKLLGPASEFPLIPDHELLQPLARGERFAGGGGDRTIKEVVMRHPDDPRKPGHRIIFNVSADPNVWKRIEGKDRVLGVYIDEAAGTKELLTECFRRLLETNSHPDIRREAGGGFISWSATETKINEAFIEFIGKCGDPSYPEYELFKIGANENVAIDEAERAKMAQNMSIDDYNVSMKNEGRAYDKYAIYGRQWNDIRHVRATDYEVSPDDNLWVGYDPGYDHNTGLCVAVINQASPYKLRFVKFWCHPKTTIAQDIDLLRRWLRGRAIEALVYDPACHKTEKGSGKQLVTIIREELQRANIKCYRGLRMPYNSHDPGIFAVRRYLDPVPTNPNAEALIELNPSLKSGCQRARQQMVMYRSHEEGRFTGPHGVVKKDDEFPDLVRYLCQATGRSPWNNGEAPSVQRPCWVKRAPNLPKWEEGQEVEVVAADPLSLSPEETLQVQRHQRSAMAASLRSRNGKRRRLAMHMLRRDSVHDHEDE
jgi:hypothetical protein